MSLTGGGPFTVPTMNSNYKYQQTIVLMSDGLNTENRWDGNGSSQSPQVDARMSLACTNAKAAGLTVYTIHVNTNGDPTSTVLKNCASGPSQLLHRDFVGPAQHRVQPDRHPALAAAHLELTGKSKRIAKGRRRLTGLLILCGYRWCDGGCEMAPTPRVPETFRVSARCRSHQPGRTT